MRATGTFETTSWDKQEFSEEEESMGDTMAQYRRALETTDAVIRAVPADRWDAPSPCAGWSAIDLVGHLIFDQRLAQAWLADRAPEPQPTPPGALAGADPRAAWFATCDATLAAMTPEALSREMTTQYFGTVRVGDLIQRLIVFDLVVHAWDLARATSQAVRLDPELVGIFFTWARDNEALMRGSGQFGPARPAPPDADEQTRFIAFVGRTV
jgi:uncharacterized protein (TIGR03086 family)